MSHPAAEPIVPSSTPENDYTTVSATERLRLSKPERTLLWNQMVDFVESYLEEVHTGPVSPGLDPEALESFLKSFTFETALPATSTFGQMAAALRDHQVHTPHPQYFGLFNPAPAVMGIVADTLVATLNPQLAGWSHSPLASSIEIKLIRDFAGKFGLDPDRSDGTFTTGGAEANQTAILCALSHRWRQFLTDGVQALPNAPTIYVSSEAHHSFLKSARASGLGSDAIRYVPVGDDLRMDVVALQDMLANDRALGRTPFLIVGTAGATGSGVVDPLPSLATIAREEDLWFHVDAAWGGGAMMVPELRPALAGVEEGDSITFDPHKWMSVPMGAGMFLTKHPHILGQTFGLRTSYMPKEGAHLNTVDPYTHSMQWSRRHIGLKLFLTLAVTGWDGYREVIGHQAKMGRLLKQRLTAEGWKIVNDTPLPVVCFTEADGDRDVSYYQRIANAVIESGNAWISTVVLNGQTPALRACITNYRTDKTHIEALIAALHKAKRLMSSDGDR